MTNEQKLEYLKATFKRRIYGIKTLAEFKTFIVNITPTKVKNAIKAGFKRTLILIQ